MTPRIMAHRRRANSASGLGVTTRLQTELELDHAFLDWFESRLANGRPEPTEEDVLGYLVAWGLHALR